MCIGHYSDAETCYSHLALLKYANVHFWCSLLRKSSYNSEIHTGIMATAHYLTHLFFYYCPLTFKLQAYSKLDNL